MEITSYEKYLVRTLHVATISGLTVVKPEIVDYCSQMQNIKNNVLNLPKTNK